MPEMGDDDRPSHDKGDIHGVVQFLIRKPGLHTLKHVVVNAVVASQDHGCNETQQLFRFPGQGTIGVRIRIEVEKAFDAQVIPLLKDAIIHPLPVRFKFVKSIGHGSQ
jgi:hypothetical protein